MFAVVFPLGPLLALVNNQMERRVDLYKLTATRRPAFIDRYAVCLRNLSYIHIHVYIYIDSFSDT